MMRGSPVVLVILPLVKLVEPTDTPGLPQFGWLNRLNASMRTSTRGPPDMRLMSTDERLNRCRRSLAHGPSLVETSGCGFVYGSISGSAKELPMSVPGSPWLMHLL